MLDRAIRRKTIAIIGSGISGMSAAWLLSQRHDVTIYEKDTTVGGHCKTVELAEGPDPIPVDMGFIVYNEKTYPNLTALFDLLKVPTKPSEMSFGVSLDGGALEYSGTSLASLFAQKRNVFSPRFWAMLNDLRRFYHDAPRHLEQLDETNASLGDYLVSSGYTTAFRDDHLLPMAAAIWSAPPKALLDYPAASFIRFHDNHGLLQIRNRPAWRTVVGGSQAYVRRLTQGFADRINLNCAASAVRRGHDYADVRDSRGRTARFDDVVIATNASDALTILTDATPLEQSLLGAFGYSRNVAVMHTDPAAMPKRRTVWSSWNYVGLRDEDSDPVAVTYWMNRLQGIRSPRPVFVTLNPADTLRSERIVHTQTFEHPLFDGAAIAAQKRLWDLQGHHNTWFCGAYFGAGFHEDGLQAGLAVAEELGGMTRPWQVAEPSGRIVRGIRDVPATARAAA